MLLCPSIIQLKISTVLMNSKTVPAEARVLLGYSIELLALPFVCLALIALSNLVDALVDWLYSIDNSNRNSNNKTKYKFTRSLAWSIHILSTPLSLAAILASVLLAVIAGIVEAVIAALHPPDTHDKEGVGTRMNFLKNAYSVVSNAFVGQTIATTAVSSVFVLYKPLQEFAVSHIGLLDIAYMGTFLVLLALIYYRNSFPVNYLLLALLTLLDAYDVGFTVSFFSLTSVLTAAVVSAGLCGILTRYAKRKHKFTSLAAPTCTALWILTVVTFVEIFIPMPPRLELAISVFGVVIFCVLLVIETNLIEPSEDDFLNLFLFVLSVVGERHPE